MSHAHDLRQFQVTFDHHQVFHLPWVQRWPFGYDSVPSHWKHPLGFGAGRLYWETDPCFETFPCRHLLVLETLPSSFPMILFLMANLIITARWSRNGPVWRYPIPTQSATFRFECSKLLQTLQSWSNMTRPDLYSQEQPSTAKFSQVQPSSDKYSQVEPGTAR